VAEEDAKEHRRRVDQRAERRASRPPEVGGSEDDPLLGPVRLSDLISRFSYGPVEEVRVDGRPTYALDFAPRPGRAATRALDRALGSLAGRVLVDATDLQVVSVDARLVTPFRVGGGLAASIRSASIAYRAQRFADGAWLPCLVGIRLQGRTGGPLPARPRLPVRVLRLRPFPRRRGVGGRQTGGAVRRIRAVTPSKRRLVLGLVLAGAFAGFFFAFRTALVPATHADHDHGILNLDAGGYLEVLTREGRKRNLVGAPGRVLAVTFVDPADPAAPEELRGLFAFQEATKGSGEAEVVVLVKADSFAELDAWLATNALVPPVPRR
jgi:hypothetical protein